MKNLILFLTALLALTSCGTTKTTQQKAQDIAATRAKVEKALMDRKFEVDFNYVHPRIMEPHFLSLDYNIKVSKDSLMSMLPYYGRAYRVTFDFEAPLDFNAKLYNYYLSYKDSTTLNLKFFTVNKEERFEYNMDISNDGTVSLRVSSIDRDFIDFTGEMVFPDETKKQNTK